MDFPPQVHELAEIAAGHAREARQREAARRASRTRLGWYLTSPIVGHSDNQAIKALELRRFRTYYPMIREKHLLPKRELTRRQRRAGVEIIAVRDRPYLPRYVFVEMDPGAGDWEKITAECGITGLVCKDRKPVRFQPELIEAMQSREIGGAIPGALPALATFQVGDAVEVTDGPFSAFPGIVEELRTKTISGIDIIIALKVAIDIFGRPTPVELECDQVVKLDREAQQATTGPTTQMSRP